MYGAGRKLPPPTLSHQSSTKTATDTCGSTLQPSECYSRDGGFPVVFGRRSDFSAAPSHPVMCACGCSRCHASNTGRCTVFWHACVVSMFSEVVASARPFIPTRGTHAVGDEVQVGRAHLGFKQDDAQATTAAQIHVLPASCRFR